MGFILNNHSLRLLKVRIFLKTSLISISKKADIVAKFEE